MVVSCPNSRCKKRWKIDDSFAGSSVSCPACKTVIVIPGQISKVREASIPPVIPSEATISSEVSHRPFGRMLDGEIGSLRDAPPQPKIQQAPRVDGITIAPVASDSDADTSSVRSTQDVQLRSPTQASVSGIPITPPPLPPTGRHTATIYGASVPTVPPPLPMGLGAKKSPGGGGSISPPPPPARPASAGNSINLVINGFVRAVNARRIGFFVLGVIVLGLLLGVPVGLLFGLAFAVKSMILLAICMLLIVVLCIGLLGVLAGGVAHMADMDERGRAVNIGGAFGFCASRFGSLFMGTVLFTAVIVVVFAAVNGLILLLSQSGMAGSFLTAFLFLPQIVINLALVVALVASVLVPIAIAVENIPAQQAIGRLQTCVCRDAGRLFVHFAISVMMGIVAMMVLGVLVGPCALTVLLTNGFLSTGFTELAFSEYNSGPDFLRMFSMGFAEFAVIAFLATFWIGSFTSYYKDALRRGFGARPSVSVQTRKRLAVVSCPNQECGKRFKVDDKHRGKRISCPFCKKSFMVPPLPPPPQIRYGV